MHVLVIRYTYLCLIWLFISKELLNFSRRQAVDVALQAMTKWPDNVPSEDSFFRTKQDLMLQILMNRFTLNSSTPELQLKFFTKTIAYLLRWIGDAIVRSQSTDQKWQPLVGYHLFISAKEGYAAERSAGTVLYSKGEYHRPHGLCHKLRNKFDLRNGRSK